MRVLLVEDNELVRSCLIELMLEENFEVVGAPDAESALELTKAAPPPQIIVSDVNLGSGMNGFEFVDQARRQWPDVAVLLISGVEANFAGRRCRATEKFLTKPFSSKMLFHYITELANGLKKLAKDHG